MSSDALVLIPRARFESVAGDALDALCRALVASALDRPRDVPPTLKNLTADLGEEIAYVRKLLRRDAD